MSSRTKSIYRVLFLALVGCLSSSVPFSDQPEQTDVDFEVLIDELEDRLETGQEIQEVNDGEKCSICQYCFENSEKVSRPCLNSLGHAYHPNCILKWINSGRSLSHSCPCCRRPFAICDLCDSLLGKKGENVLFCNKCQTQKFMIFSVT